NCTASTAGSVCSRMICVVCSSSKFQRSENVNVQISADTMRSWPIATKVRGLTFKDFMLRSLFLHPGAAQPGHQGERCAGDHEDRGSPRRLPMGEERERKDPCDVEEAVYK